MSTKPIPCRVCWYSDRECANTPCPTVAEARLRGVHVYGSSGSPGDVLERTSPDPRIAAFEHIRAEIADWLAVRPATAVRFLGQLVEHDEAKSAEAVVNVVKALRRYSDDLEKAPRRCTVCGAPHDEHGRRVLVP